MENWYQPLSLLATVIIAALGWWYRSRKDIRGDGERSGEIKTSLSGLERSLQTIKGSIGEVKESLLTCRREETERINRLEDRVNGIKTKRAAKC